MRENEILQLMASAMQNKLIASQLGIALGTVKAHVKATLDELGACSRTQATVIAAQRDLLATDSPLRRACVHRRPQPVSPRGETHSEWHQLAA